MLRLHPTFRAYNPVFQDKPSVFAGMPVPTDVDPDTVRFAIIEFANEYGQPIVTPEPKVTAPAPLTIIDVLPVDETRWLIRLFGGEKFAGYPGQIDIPGYGIMDVTFVVLEPVVGVVVRRYQLTGQADEENQLLTARADGSTFVLLGDEVLGNA